MAKLKQFFKQYFIYICLVAACLSLVSANLFTNQHTHTRSHVGRVYSNNRKFHLQKRIKTPRMSISLYNWVFIISNWKKFIGCINHKAPFWNCLWGEILKISSSRSHSYLWRAQCLGFNGLIILHSFFLWMNMRPMDVCVHVMMLKVNCKLIFVTFSSSLSCVWCFMCWCS